MIAVCHGQVSAPVTPAFRFLESLFPQVQSGRLVDRESSPVSDEPRYGSDDFPDIPVIPSGTVVGNQSFQAPGEFFGFCSCSVPIVHNAFHMFHEGRWQVDHKAACLTPDDVSQPGNGLRTDAHVPRLRSGQFLH